MNHNLNSVKAGLYDGEFKGLLRRILAVKGIAHKIPRTAVKGFEFLEGNTVNPGKLTLLGCPAATGRALAVVPAVGVGRPARIWSLWFRVWI